MSRSILTFLSICFLALHSATAQQKVIFKDPEGDDNGPGSYTYPTDAAYKKGSFDIRELLIEKKTAGKLEITVTINAALEDPWRYGTGFSLQMLFLFIDTDQKLNSGFTQTIPGLNAVFDPKDGWEKCIVLSPQTPQRITAEIKAKAVGMESAILVPARTKGIGQKITATVYWPDDVDITTCSYQLVMQSNEGFPAGTDLLTRPVSQYETKQRFGGGNDGNCDPHIIDLLAGKATGNETEKKAQYSMLSYECAIDGSNKKTATLQMIKPSVTN